MARTVDAEAHSVRRDAFVDAAQRLMQAKGYEQMSIRDVLDEVGASRGAFYHYFASKTELLEAVVTRIVEASLAAATPVLEDPALDAVAKLEGLFGGIAQWKMERSELMLALTRVWLSDENTLMRDKMWRRLMLRLTPALAGIIRQGVAEGAFSVSSPDETARVLVALIHGLNDTAVRLFVERDEGGSDAGRRGSARRRLRRGAGADPRAAGRLAAPHRPAGARGVVPVNGATNGAPAVLTEQLTKSYGRSRVRGIVRLDLEVRPGEVFGFLGPNGAGKTTTIRVLLDLIRPTSGRALVLGRDSHSETLAIQARSGYLPGELYLYPNLTGRETLRYLANLRGGVDWDYVAALAARLDCDLDRKVADLSAGNKRKVGLIQAFMHRPELLILDEPTSGLDPLVQHEFYHLLDEAREAGQTVFLSSHVLPEVQRVCDRVAFVREGELVAVEDVAELMGRAVREVEVVFGAPVPPSAFEGVPGVTRVVTDGKDASTLRLTVTGSLDPAVKALAGYPVVDLLSQLPDLEDVFMTFYEGGEGARRGPLGGEGAGRGKEGDEGAGRGPSAGKEGDDVA